MVFAAWGRMFFSARTCTQKAWGSQWQKFCEFLCTLTGLCWCRYLLGLWKFYICIIKSVVVKCLKLLGKWKRGNFQAERGKTLQVHLQLAQIWPKPEARLGPGRHHSCLWLCYCFPTYPWWTPLISACLLVLTIHRCSTAQDGPLPAGSPVPGGCSGWCSGAGAARVLREELRAVVSRHVVSEITELGTCPTAQPLHSLTHGLHSSTKGEWVAGATRTVYFLFLNTW